MRATVERNQQGGVDEFRNPLPGAFKEVVTVPCFAWSSARREVVDGEKNVVVEDIRAIVPAEADVTEADRVGRVANRRGRVLFAGPFRIDKVARKEGHVELLLQRAA